MSASAVKALATSWRAMNKELFRGALRPPALTLSEGKRLGAWDRASRTIQIQAALVAEQPWAVVVEVLKHEMAHQYVDEVLRVHDETPHGAAFHRVCAQIGADPRAAGMPVATEEPGAMRKVRKLLALAESANLHEAEAAAQAAHRLMRRHNIEVVDEPAAFGASLVGRVARRHMAWEQALGGLLGEHFFVYPIWTRAWIAADDTWGKQLELCGRPENLALAEHVHSFVSAVGQRLWQEHRRTSGATGRARGRFLSGVVAGFGVQLDRQASQCEETGLVWVGDPRAQAWYERRHPSTRSGGTLRVRADDAYRSGRAAGEKLVLKRPIQDTGQGPTKLLR